MPVDLDAGRDDLPGKPIQSLFLCSSLFHLWPELTGPATPKPAVAESNPPALWLQAWQLR